MFEVASHIAPKIGMSATSFVETLLDKAMIFQSKSGGKTVYGEHDFLKETAAMVSIARGMSVNENSFGRNLESKVYTDNLFKDTAMENDNDRRALILDILKPKTNHIDIGRCRIWKKHHCESIKKTF